MNFENVVFYGSTVFLIAVVFTVIYVKTGDFTKAFMGVLTVVKAALIIAFVSGMDREIIRLYLFNRVTRQFYVVSITACEMGMLITVGMFVSILVKKYLARYLPEEVRPLTEGVATPS